MNITNLEVTQAAIDMFFCLVCIIMVVSIRANNPKQKSMKSFIHLFLIAAFLFLGETLAYIFRGNLGVFNVTVTRASNLVVFAMNVAMAHTYVRYVQAVFDDRGVEVSNKYIEVAKIFSAINILILAVNLVYPWMYYFDEANYYHRNNMWYVYTVLSLVIIFSGAGMAIKYRKQLETRSFVSIMLFSFIPIIATVIQLFVYGLSITNLGLGIGSFIMFVAYIYDWSHDGVEQIEKIKKHRFDMVILFAIMLLSMSASIIACGNVIQRVTRDNSKMQSETIAQMVAAEVENEFIKPVTVSQTISQDLTIRSYIDGDTKEEAEAVKDDMTAHLVSIGNEFGYQMVFVASEKTRAYYTYEGISKYLDVVNDSHDIWYKDFLDSGKEYVVNVDTDENNNWDLAVFINYGIFDDNGNVLGVCGAGVDMNDLMDLIAKYEELYGIKIDLVNHDGLIQIDSDGSIIEVDYLDNSYFDRVTGTDFYYQIIDGSCYMTKYISEFDWYLVVREDNPVKIDAEYVNNAGADFAGLVFWDKSKRNLTFEEAREIRKVLNSEIKTLGVFVDRDIDDIAYLVKEGIISGVQLHGSEDEDTIKKVRAAVPKGTWILKAFEVKSIEDVEKAQNSSADMVLIDSGKGSGKVFDWELLSHLKRDYILAGGLGIENVSEAVETLHPFAVDVSSGVETDRFKDESKINDFCNAVKQADGRQ